MSIDNMRSNSRAVDVIQEWLGDPYYKATDLIEFLENKGLRVVEEY